MTSRIAPTSSQIWHTALHGIDVHHGHLDYPSPPTQIVSASHGTIVIWTDPARLPDGGAPAIERHQHWPTTGRCGCRDALESRWHAQGAGDVRGLPVRAYVDIMSTTPSGRVSWPGERTGAAPASQQLSESKAAAERLLAGTDAVILRPHAVCMARRHDAAAPPVAVGAPWSPGPAGGCAGAASAHPHRQSDPGGGARWTPTARRESSTSRTPSPCTLPRHHRVLGPRRSAGADHRHTAQPPGEAPVRRVEGGASAYPADRPDMR